MTSIAKLSEAVSQLRASTIHDQSAFEAKINNSFDGILKMIEEVKNIINEERDNLIAHLADHKVNTNDGFNTLLGTGVVTTKPPAAVGTNKTDDFKSGPQRLVGVAVSADDGTGEN